MNQELQEFREKFRDEMPGMQVVDQMLQRVDQFITAHNELRDKWNTMSPAKVQALRAIIQAVLDAPAGVSAAVKTRITDALREAGGCPACSGLYRCRRSLAPATPLAESARARVQ